MLKIITLALLYNFTTATHKDDDPTNYCFFKTEVFSDKTCSSTPISCHMRFYIVDDCVPVDDTSSRKITGCSGNAINYTEYASRNCDSTIKFTEK